MASDKLNQTLKSITSLPGLILSYVVKLYQVTLSPDHSWVRHFFTKGYCRYHPTCSEYCRQALREHGAVGGIILGSSRILRCNPWSPGGVDEVPPKEKTPRTKTKTVQSFS